MELSSGAKLVDLPGFNDTNKVRESISNTYLNSCNYIWALAGTFEPYICGELMD